MDDGFKSFDNDAWEDGVVDKIDVWDCEKDPVFGFVGVKDAFAVEFPT